MKCLGGVDSQAIEMVFTDSMPHVGEEEFPHGARGFAVEIDGRTPLIFVAL